MPEMIDLRAQIDLDEEDEELLDRIWDALGEEELIGEKANPYHDERGRFAESPGGVSGSSDVLGSISPGSISGTPDKATYDYYEQSDDLRNRGASGWDAKVEGVARAVLVDKISRDLVASTEAKKLLDIARAARDSRDISDTLPLQFKDMRTVDDLVAYRILRMGITTSDDDSWALSLQMSIAKEFGLNTDRLFHSASDNSISDARRISARDEVFDRRLARIMYDATQADLASHGVKEVELTRGMEFIAGAVPDELKKPGVINIRSMPISSYTDIPSVVDAYFAKTYDGSQAVTLSVTVPANRVFSTGRTGYGDANIHEWLVLDGPGQAMSRVE